MWKTRRSVFVTLEIAWIRIEKEVDWLRSSQWSSKDNVISFLDGFFPIEIGIRTLDVEGANPRQSTWVKCRNAF